MKHIKLFENFWDDLPTLPPADISKPGETVLWFGLYDTNWYAALMPTNEVDEFLDSVDRFLLAYHMQYSNEKRSFPIGKVENMAKESRPGIAYVTLSLHNNFKPAFEDASYEEKTWKYALWITGDGGTAYTMNPTYHSTYHLRNEDKEGQSSIACVLKRGKIITIYPGAGGISAEQKEETLSEFLENIYSSPY